MNLDNNHSQLTIGLVADLHYAPITVGSRYCSESLTKLQASVDMLKARDLDLVVCLGDVIDKSETVKAELECIREVKASLNSLSAEKHFVLGNHDVSELTKEQFLGAVEARDSYYSFDCKGVHIVILDSNFNPDGSPFAPGNFSWNDAWIGDEQIAWLQEDLKSAGDTPTLIFCHANLDHRVRKDGSLNGHIVRDATRVRAILEESGSVKAVIQGHDHGGNKSTINGIPYIILRALVEGSGLEQNSFAILSLLENGEVVVEGFGQQQSLDQSTLPDETALFLSPPVVQHAGAMGFTLSIEVNRFCMGRIEWGFAEDQLTHMVVPVRGGLAHADERCLVISATFDEPLSADQPIFYRVVGESLEYANAYEITRGKPFHTAVRKLLLPHEDQESITLAVINDTHNRKRTLPPLAKLIEEVDPDLLVWNGDVCGEFNEADDPHAILLRPGASGPTPSCGGWASSRPLLYVAGNHDVRGVRARELPSIFPPGPHPELPYNTALRFGPVALIGLDAGEDKPDNHPVFGGTAAYEPHRQRQAEWLAGQLTRPEIAEAPFKLAFCHIPLRGLPGEADGKSLKKGAELWLPQLINAGFHAVVSGHTHQWLYNPPTEDAPITQIVGGGPSPDTATLIVIKITTTTLTICTRDLSGQTLGEESWVKDSEKKGGRETAQQQNSRM
jgi:3',5'-cyclic AMP phosphodiesterase CpdA